MRRTPSLVLGVVLATASLVTGLAPGGAAHAEDKPKTGASAQSGRSEGKNPVVVIKTNKGDIRVELLADKAPISVKNFLSYADDGFYDGTVFHRVIDGFMIQGGGFDKNLQQKPTKAAIKNEADNGLKNERGTLAMARTSQVDSATSQFFINLVDNAFLNHGERDFGYAVFAKVVGGMDVVDEIAKVQTRRQGPHEAVPADPVVIESVKRAD